MSDLLRFGVSIDEDLLENFDRFTTDRGYTNRSEALRDLIRDALVQQRLDASHDAQVLGSLTLVYDHHARDLSERMNELQHDSHEMVVSVMHIHISHDDCLEVIVLRGELQKIRTLADALLSLKGVKHGKLFVTLPTRSLTHAATPAHSHRHPHKRKTRSNSVEA